jgi:hypothetical protein
MKWFWPVVAAALVAGCRASAPTLAAPAPQKQGIFLVSAQSQEQPTVVVENDTYAIMHLLMNNADGKAFELVVQPHSTGKTNLPKGHYDAKVYDENGKVRSSFGSADIAKFKEYRARFVVEDGGTYRFHIGD